jgi:uncharacterized hydrophobic protein (TIGR00271 family)
MLHVRVASPAELTAGVVELLGASPGVANLMVLPGVVRRPSTAHDAAQFGDTAQLGDTVQTAGTAQTGDIVPFGDTAQTAGTAPLGDAVQFDLATSAANQVLGRLRRLQARQLGPIAVEAVDAVIETGRPGPPRRRRGAFFHSEAAPAWDLVESQIIANSVYAPSFYLLLMLAGLIGAVGILTDSSILIVGAMVVGPEYNATIAVALGIDQRNGVAVSRGLLALLAGFAATIAVTLLFGLVIRGAGHVPRAYELGLRPVTDFINSPDLFSVIVAVLAGIIGVVSLTEARTGALIGVFISVTTIPAAADTGLSLAFQNWAAARGAVLQLVLNLVLLIAVGAVGLRGQRLFWRRRSAARS